MVVWLDGAAAQADCACTTARWAGKASRPVCAGSMWFVRSQSVVREWGTAQRWRRQARTWLMAGGRATTAGWSAGRERLS